MDDRRSQHRNEVNKGQRDSTRALRRALGRVSAIHVCLLALGGCAVVDPDPDYQCASQIIAERTGVAEPTPLEPAEQLVEDSLEDGLTIDEAVTIALANNPDFQSRFAEIGAARADVVQSRLLSNPTLSLGLQFPEGGGLTDITVGFAQQLADLWQIPVRRQMAEADLERTIFAVGQQAVELAAEVRTRYFRVLALQRAVDYIEENERIVQRSIDSSEAQFRAGEVNELDVNLARTGALDVQEEQIRTRGELAQAQAELAQSLGLGAMGADMRLSGTLPSDIESVPELGVLLDSALDDRFDIRVAWFAVQRAEADLRLQYRRFLPDVQLGFAFERSERRSLPGRKILADTARDSIAAGKLTAPTIQSRGERALEKSQIIDAKLGPTLALTLPIFDQNQAQIAKARVRVLQARKDYAARVNAVAAEIESAAALANASAALLNFQQTVALQQAQTTVEGAEQRYRAGEENVLVLLEAQDELIKRRRAHVNALRDFAVALARLENAVGGQTIYAAAAANAALGEVSPETE